MTFEIFLSRIAASPISLAAYVVMAGVLLETIILNGLALRENHRASKLKRWLQSATAEDAANMHRLVASYLNERLVPLRHRLASRETAAAYLSLFLTLGTYALAMISGQFASHDGSVMVTLGLGAGLTCQGILAAAMTHVTSKRLDMILDRLDAELETRRPARPSVALVPTTGEPT